MMQTGEVSKIMREKGFGFIKIADVQEDFFFHASNLEGIDFDGIQKGQSVYFRIGLGHKGLSAANVRLAKMKL
jgi:cold shock protein